MPKVKLDKNFRRYRDLINKEAPEKLDSCADLVLSNWVTMLTTGARSGRLYNGHRASAPGEPPAAWTSELVSSLDKEHTDEPAVFVGAKAEHASWLEFGTFKMEPRPHLRPVFEQSKDEIQKILSSKWF